MSIQDASAAQCHLAGKALQSEAFSRFATCCSPLAASVYKKLFWANSAVAILHVLCKLIQLFVAPGQIHAKSLSSMKLGHMEGP
jgi:hypothetical protein